MTKTTPLTLVTGARGMLGSAILRHFQTLGRAAVGIDIDDCDLTDEAAARQTIRRLSPARVLHCAAWTDVERAEDQPEACIAANAHASRHLARACREAHAAITLLSTDFVFDGRAAARPLKETDPPNPLGVYGLSKLQAERAVAEELPNHQIVRTAWLFGPGGRNFVRAILNRLRATPDPLRVVADQTGCPTFTLDLAQALVALADTGATGIIHLTNDGRATWFQLARAAAEIDGHDPERIHPIAATEWPGKAPRPAWSVLDGSRARALGVPPLRPWRQALEDYIRNYFD